MPFSNASDSYSLLLHILSVATSSIYYTVPVTVGIFPLTENSIEVRLQDTQEVVKVEVSDTELVLYTGSVYIR